MDILNNDISHSQRQKDEQDRNQQFIKRLSTETPLLININKTSGPTLSLSELSLIEQEIYSAWWDELDPFGLGIVVNEAMHPFLQASGLVEETLEQIIDFYIDESRYTEDQFYAILRLVAHGQNGRKINRDLVALGAPLANFDQDTIDSLFSQGNNQSITKPATDKGVIRNTWWGQRLSQKDTPGTMLFLTPRQQNHHIHELDTANTTSYRHSIAGSHMPALDNNDQSSPHAFSDTTTPSPNQPKPFDWAEKALSSSTRQTATVHENTQQSTLEPSELVATEPSELVATSRDTTKTTNSRRSVPYASQDVPPADTFLCDTISATQSNQEHPSPVITFIDNTPCTHRLHQQQSSIDHGQSLLLTQKFTPPSSTTKSTNPFEHGDDDDDISSKPDSDKATIVDQTLASVQHHQNTTKNRRNCTTAANINEESSLPIKKTTINNTSPASGSMTCFKGTPTLVDVDDLPFQSLSCISSGRNNTPPPPSTSPQFTQPDLTLYNRHQLLKRSASQHDVQKHSFISQGAFLLATSSPSVQFPTQPPTIPSDDTSRLHRHRSITSLPK